MSSLAYGTVMDIIHGCASVKSHLEMPRCRIASYLIRFNESFTRIEWLHLLVSLIEHLRVSWAYNKTESGPAPTRPLVYIEYRVGYIRLICRSHVTRTRQTQLLERLDWTDRD